MIEHVRDASIYLYHYTSMATALDYIFKNGTLRLGVYAKTNDPKETKTWQFRLGTNENRDLGRFSMDELSSWLSSELKGRARLLCFSTDRQPITGDHLTDIFNRGFCKPRMWSQYADKHQGVCLVFHREKLTALVDKQLGGRCLLHSGQVSYVDRSIARDLFGDQQYTINMDVLASVGRAEYAERHLATHWQKLFFEKMTDWRDESEWRCVAFPDSDADLFVTYSGALVGIVFGEEASPELIQSAIDSTAGQGIRYAGLKWKNCSPWYDYASMSRWRVSKSGPEKGGV